MRDRHRLIIAVWFAATWSGGGLAAQIDPSGQWRTWRTEHFRVHARPSLAGAAVTAAAEAERAYVLLAATLTPPRGPIDLVLADNVDFSNGFATTFPSNRVTVYLAPPGPDVSLGSYDGWLRLVIMHELTHVFHLDRADGVWRVAQTILGRAPGTFPNRYQPSWVLEGLATYYESRLTDAGRLRGSFHDQLLSAAGRGERWPAPGDAVFTNPLWPGGRRPYAWGSRLFNLAADAAHDSAIVRFVDRTSRQLIPYNVSQPLRGAAGVSLPVLWDRLRDTARMGGGTSPDVILVRGLRDEPLARLSADGEYLAYRQSDDRNVQRVVVVRRETGERVAEHRTNAVQGLAWCDTRLCVSQLDFDSPVRIAGDVYRWDVGGDWTRLSSGARWSDVFSVSASPAVGVVGLRSGRRVLARLSVAAGDVEPYPAPPADDWGRVAVSPDGKWVAAARHANGRWDIVMWPVGEPSRFQSITDDAALDGDPAWAGTDLLLFASERAGLPQVMGYDRPSRRMRQLTHAANGAREPMVAPDGRLSYSTLLADGYAIVADSTRHDTPLDDRAVPPSPFVPAPAVPFAETAYVPWPSLRPRYWLPIAHGERDAGTFFGAVTTGVDVLGRSAYAAFVSVAPSRERWEAVVSAAHTRWRSWSVDVTAGQTWDFAGFARSASGGVVPVSFRERSAEVGLRYRYRRWRSGMEWRVGSFAEQDALVNDGTEPLSGTPANRTFAGGVVSLRAWRIERPRLSISPENGLTFAGLALRRWQIGGAGWSTELRAGLNGYVGLPLPGFAHWVLAARVTAGVTGGPTPTVYSLGGQSGDALDLVPGYSLGSGRRKFPLRGYGRGTERFTRAVAGYLELRIPLVAVGRGIWKLPVLLDRVSLAPFAEVAGGWNAGESAELTQYRDVGGELVVDLGVGDLPLRVRAGGAVALADGLGSDRWDGRTYLVFGASF